MSNLRHRFLAGFRFGVTEQLSVRMFDALALVMLLRSLQQGEVALFGVVSGMVIVFNLFGLTPENVIMRSYPEWDTKEKARTAIEALQCFAVCRTVVLVVVGCTLAFVLGDRGKVILYTTAYTLAVQLGLLAEISRLAFRATLQQRTVVIVDSVLRCMLVLCLLYLIVSPHFATYLTIYIAWAGVTALVWATLIRRETGAAFRARVEHVTFLRECIKDFSLWHHLGTIAVFAIYSIDPWVMDLMGVPREIIGEYTLALKICSFFFVMPMFVQSMTMVLSANVRDRKGWPSVFSRILGLNAVLAISQWVFFAAFGKVIIVLFGGAEHVERVFEYAMLINTGVLVLNFARPMIAHLVSRANMRQVFCMVYLPSCLSALALYSLLTYCLGAHGTAVASLLSYLLLAVLVISFMNAREMRVPLPRVDVQFVLDVLKYERSIVTK